MRESVGEVSTHQLPFDKRDHQSYVSAREECEILVHIEDAHTLQAVDCALIWDKSRNGGKGRCLVMNLPELGLRRMDR